MSIVLFIYAEWIIYLFVNFVQTIMLMFSLFTKPTYKLVLDLTCFTCLE